MAMIVLTFLKIVLEVLFNNNNIFKKRVKAIWGTKFNIAMHLICCNYEKYQNCMFW